MGPYKVARRAGCIAVAFLLCRAAALPAVAADPIPNDLIVDPKPVEQTWPWNGSGEETLLTLRNTTTLIAEFERPAVVSFTRKSGDSQASVAARTMPVVAPAGCRSPLGPNESCSIAVKLGDQLTPGEYSVEVGVAGIGGGWSMKAQIVRVRASAIIAFIVIVLGMAAGWYVQYWRAGGRRATAWLIEIGRLRERVGRLSPKPADQDIAPLFARLTEQIEEADMKCRGGINVTGDIDRLIVRANQLVGAADMHRAFAALPEAGRKMLRARRDALMEKLRSEADDAGRHAVALAADLNAFTRLANSVNNAKDLLTAIENLRKQAATDVNDPAAESASESLKAAIEAAQALLPAEPDGGTVIARLNALDAKIADAEKAAASFADAVASKLLELAKSQESLVNGDPDLKGRVDQLISRLSTLAATPTGNGAAARLAELVPLWGDYRAIAAAALTKTGTPTARAAAEGPEIKAIDAGMVLPPLDVPVAVLLPSSGATLAQLQRNQRRHEIVTNLIILVAAGIAGVLALWATNSTWGSVVDLGTAFLAGMAARVVIGEVAPGQPAGGAAQ